MDEDFWICDLCFPNWHPVASLGEEYFLVKSSDNEVFIFDQHGHDSAQTVRFAIVPTLEPGDGIPDEELDLLDNEDEYWTRWFDWARGFDDNNLEFKKIDPVSCWHFVNAMVALGFQANEEAFDYWLFSYVGRTLERENHAREDAIQEA